MLAQHNHENPARWMVSSIISESTEHSTEPPKKTRRIRKKLAGKFSRLINDIKADLRELEMSLTGKDMLNDMAEKQEE
ncbi:MAG: hypothetical protein OEZ59_03615 [Deltaproteobacteria bacterium]|nr:hypothetical protein [Deltaproteobacteria bacterium]